MCHPDRRSHWPTGPPKVMKNALCPATALHGSFALPFVIPTELGGRVRSAITQFTVSAEIEGCPSLLRPGIPATNLQWKPTFPFVSLGPKRSGASAVPRTFPGNVFRQSVAQWRDLLFLFRFSHTLKARTLQGRPL